MSRVESTTDLAVPAARAFAAWSAYPLLPGSAPGIEEIRRTAAGRLHWTAAIGGTRTEWDAAYEEVAGERVTWTPLDGGPGHSGSVVFTPTGPDSSAMTVTVEYPEEDRGASASASSTSTWRASKRRSRAI